MRHRTEAGYILRPAAGWPPSKTADSCQQADPSKRTFQKRAAASQHLVSSSGTFLDNWTLLAEPLENNNKEEQSEKSAGRESCKSSSPQPTACVWCAPGRPRVYKQDFETSMPALGWFSSSIQPSSPQTQWRGIS